MNHQPRGLVLVPVDRSLPALHAAWRAALVARELGASVRLLHVRGHDAADSGEDDAHQLARDIGGHVGVDVAVQVADGDPLAAIVRAAGDALLVVIGSRRGNPLREFVLGTQAERLIRLCRVPVLVVKRAPTRSYQRVLVPVELDAAATAIIRAAARVAREHVEVLHALDARMEATLRACDVPEPVVRRERQRAADRARRRLQDLIAGAGQLPGTVLPMVGLGHAASLVLAREQAVRAELVVIGKRSRGLLADFVLGSVTQRVLARARADVLVLPQGRESAAGVVLDRTPGFVAPGGAP